eukprot:gene4259-4555_t
MSAVDNGHTEVLRFLHEHGTDVLAVAPSGCPPLVSACNAGTRRVVWFLHSIGADVNQADPSGWTPLFAAVHLKKHDYSLVALLHGWGAKVNQAARNGMTALHIAARSGDIQMTAMLLEYGANRLVTDFLGSTPLHHACSLRHTGVATILTTPPDSSPQGCLPAPTDSGVGSMHSCSPSCDTSWGPLGALVGACEDPETYEHSEHLESLHIPMVLIELGAPIECNPIYLPSTWGRTPLYAAARAGNWRLVKYMVESLVPRNPQLSTVTLHRHDNDLNPCPVAPNSYDFTSAYPDTESGGSAACPVVPDFAPEAFESWRMAACEALSGACCHPEGVPMVLNYLFQTAPKNIMSFPWPYHPSTCPLTVAAGAGNTAIVLWLLDKGMDACGVVDVAIQTPDGSPPPTSNTKPCTHPAVGPFFRAAMGGHLEVL